MKKKIAKGFTLVELMIVVAIIGILAAVAIPNFIKYQLRSKSSELPLQLAGLFKAQESLRQSVRNLTIDGVVDPDYVPGQYWNLGGGNFPDTSFASNFGSSKMPWDATELATARAMDWQIEGATYGRYGVSVGGCPGIPVGANAGVCFFSGGIANIDGDTLNASYAFNHRTPNTAVPGDFFYATPPTLENWTGFPGDPNQGATCVDVRAGTNVYSAPCQTTGPDVF